MVSFFPAFLPNYSLMPPLCSILCPERKAIKISNRLVPICRGHDRTHTHCAIVVEQWLQQINEVYC